LAKKRGIHAGDCDSVKVSGVRATIGTVIQAGSWADFSVISRVFREGLLTYRRGESGRDDYLADFRAVKFGERILSANRVDGDPRSGTSRRATGRRPRHEKLGRRRSVPRAFPGY